MEQKQVKRFCSCALASRPVWAVSFSAGWQTTSVESAKSICRQVPGFDDHKNVLRTTVVVSSRISSLYGVPRFNQCGFLKADFFLLKLLIVANLC